MVVATQSRPRRRFIATDKALAEVSVHGNEADGRKRNGGCNDASTRRRRNANTRNDRADYSRGDKRERTELDGETEGGEGVDVISRNVESVVSFRFDELLLPEREKRSALVPMRATRCPRIRRGASGPTTTSESLCRPRGKVWEKEEPSKHIRPLALPSQMQRTLPADGKIAESRNLPRSYSELATYSGGSCRYTTLRDTPILGVLVCGNDIAANFRTGGFEDDYLCIEYKSHRSFTLYSFKFRYRNIFVTKRRVILKIIFSKIAEPRVFLSETTYITVTKY